MIVLHVKDPMSRFSIRKRELGVCVCVLIIIDLFNVQRNFYLNVSFLLLLLIAT